MMEMIPTSKQICLEFPDIHVLRYLEYSGNSPSAPVRKSIERLKPRASKLIDVRTLNRIYRRGEEKNPYNDDLPSPTSKAEYIVFGICTAGTAIYDETVRLRNCGDFLDSMILAALGSAAVSETCEWYGVELFRWASEKSLNASRMFEPGAGSYPWGLENQRFLFANLPAHEIGVTLNQDLAMLPHATSSFVMGIGKEVTQAVVPYSCKGCPHKDCLYRYEPEQIRKE
jgi:hypothetical protein